MYEIKEALSSLFVSFITHFIEGSRLDNPFTVLFLTFIYANNTHPLQTVDGATLTRSVCSGPPGVYQGDRYI